MNTFAKKRGVTLIEMLIVVALLTILVGIVVTIATRINNQSKEQLTKNTIAILEGALEEYKDFTGSFPNPNALQPDGQPYPNPSAALYGQLYGAAASRRIVQHIDKSLVWTDGSILDAWRMPLDYQYVPGQTYPLIISNGPDKLPETSDDIKNR